MRSPGKARWGSSWLSPPATQGCASTRQGLRAITGQIQVVFAVRQGTVFGSGQCYHCLAWWWVHASLSAYPEQNCGTISVSAWCFSGVERPCSPETQHGQLAAGMCTVGVVGVLAEFRLQGVGNKLCLNVKALHGEFIGFCCLRSGSAWLTKSLAAPNCKTCGQPRVGGWWSPCSA